VSISRKPSQASPLRQCLRQETKGRVVPFSRGVLPSFLIFWQTKKHPADVGSTCPPVQTDCSHTLTGMQNGKLLCPSNTEHLCPARWAHTLGCRSSILHRYSFWILHLLLGMAFHAVCLH